MLSEQDVEEIVKKNLSSYLSSNRVDDGKVDRETMDYLINNKIDSRNIVDYTFSGTSPETFEHPLKIIPNGFLVLNKTVNGSITGDRTTWTNRKVTLTAQAAMTVRFLFL